MKPRNIIRAFLFGVAIVVGGAGKVIAQSSSTNYSVDESSFSSGSGTGTSESYQSSGSAGDLGIGNSSSTSYRAYAGPISPSEEYLEMVVTAASIDLDTPSGDPGVLSDTETAFGAANFYVRAYLNSSYVVATISQPMTNENGDTIEPLTSATTSSIGTEQFGINLVDNATPNVGSDPVPEPNASFANGEAATGYGTADSYTYNVGDTIAQNGGSPAWGRTDYTISYIVNINGITEAGLYQMVHELVAITTY